MNKLTEKAIKNAKLTTLASANLTKLEWVLVMIAVREMHTRLKNDKASALLQGVMADLDRNLDSQLNISKIAGDVFMIAQASAAGAKNDKK